MVVPAVGLEPTRLATGDFEQSVSKSNIYNQPLKTKLTHFAKTLQITL